MPAIILETHVNAPAELCFDLIRDIRISNETTSQTNEKSVAGAADGMIRLGQTVTFEGTYFGMRQQLKVRVVEFDRPRFFVDEMISGWFRAFRHVHEFLESDGGTLIRDSLIWESPFGIFGKIVDKLLIERYLQKIVHKRNAMLRDIAEG